MMYLVYVESGTLDVKLFGESKIALLSLFII